MATTPMTRFDDHRTPDGKIDWAAYDRAKVANGESCCDCGAFILIHRGYKTRCGRCENLDADPEVAHGSKLRCPSCGYSWDVGDEGSLIREEGEHGTSCPECGHEFEYSVAVEYTYTSPARTVPPPEDEPEAPEPDEGNWACGTDGPDC